MCVKHRLGATDTICPLASFFGRDSQGCNPLRGDSEGQSKEDSSCSLPCCTRSSGEAGRGRAEAAERWVSPAWQPKPSMALSHHHAGDVGPGMSQDPVTGAIACKANTPGVSGAVLWVVPWVPLRKAAALADATPGRGAGRSHLLLAPVTILAGGKELPGARDGSNSSLLPALPPSLPSRDPERAFTIHDATPTTHSAPDKRSQHPTTHRPSRRAPTCFAAVRANSLLDPLILQLAAAKTGGWESHRASRATFLPCRRLLDMPGQPPHSPPTARCHGET